MSTLYDRVAAKAGGEAALAAARLRREVLIALHEAFEASGLQSQSELARRLHVRRSAVNQVFRGDGNLRINTLAEYLHATGFELNLTMVHAGEPHQAAIEGRSARPAFWARNTAFPTIFINANVGANQAVLGWWPSSLGYHLAEVRETTALPLRSTNVTIINAGPMPLYNLSLAPIPLMYEHDVPVPESTSHQIVLGELAEESQ